MFETFTGIMIVIVFLVPGYIWRTVEGQLVYLDKRLEWEKFALGLLARSTATYGIFSELLYYCWKQNWIDVHPVYSTLVAILFVAILPAVCGLCFGAARQSGFAPWLIKRIGLRTFEQHNIPTAWDFVFSSIRPCWVILTLKDGAQLYGYLGTSSYFSSDPDARDLYISSVIRKRDDGIMEKVPGSAGVYVNKDEVSLIEFLSSEVNNGE